MDPMRRTIVHKACSFGRLQTLQAIGAVLQAAGRNALLNQQDATGKRSIDCAAERGQAHVVKWLLAHGAPVSQAQTLGAQHPAVAALFGAPPAPGRRRQRGRARSRARRRRPTTSRRFLDLRGIGGPLCEIKILRRVRAESASSSTPSTRRLLDWRCQSSPL